jgi:hypothetical protein
MKFAYLVRTNDGKMGITFNRKIAIKTAKETGGKIRFMSYSLYSDGIKGCPGDITHSWDYPTFYIQSQELVF